MTDVDRFHRDSPAWQRFRAVRTLAHHATDTSDLADLLDMLGLSVGEGRVPPVEKPPPEPVNGPIPLAEDSSERLNTLLRDALPSARDRAD
jgi:hypothetical protein